MTPLRGWRIGSVRGVQVRLHASLLFLLLYVVLVASGQFPFVVSQSGVPPETVSGSPLFWGLTFSVALVGSVLAHELAHVFLAQSMGVTVPGITLMMLGGVSQLERMPEERYAELKISIVGPLASFGIAALLVLLQVSVRSGNVALFAYWLSRANLVLGIFNLLPAFPTDGGRALRSFLSARLGRLEGTRAAVRVSHVFAWLFGIVGFLQFNLLLMLIAVFVHLSARGELSALEGRQYLAGLRAGELGRRVAPVPENFSLEEAAREMLRSRSLILPVLRGSMGVGVVTAAQFERIPRARWPRLSVRQVMVPVSDGIEADLPVEQAVEKGVMGVAGGLPLLDQGRVVGILRSADVSEAIEFRRLGQSEDREARIA